MNGKITKRMKICFFGHFGAGNFGNESTLRTIVYKLRRRFQYAEFVCICTCPDAIAKNHDIAAVPINEVIFKQWDPCKPVARLLRKVLVGIPSELHRWFRAFWTLKGANILIVPGTGLLTDAYGLSGWGPYNLFRWSCTAKLCGCKLVFLSVGVGPLYGLFGKWFVKTSLSMGDYRSYRDSSSLSYLKSIGFQAGNDQVYPDLVFSLSGTLVPGTYCKRKRRSVVGIGVMSYAGRYSVDRPRNRVYAAYLENLVLFVEWLLSHDYDVRLLIGEIGDMTVKREFKDLLREKSVLDESRLRDKPTFCAEELLSQIAETDFVVATRFHNIVFSLILNKPVLAISFHHKCLSLMEAVGLSEYCEDINQIDFGSMLNKFSSLEANAFKVKATTSKRVKEFHNALEEQYRLLFMKILNQNLCPTGKKPWLVSETGFALNKFSNRPFRNKLGANRILHGKPRS
jgi:polysaccharide pyruvyl transferase WcaK-like protein